ncbi:unnamed protein product [Ilex paraguariensis]|uniref:Uncharacterized protein n=1 Tax=Ilex paraguariensis TaxID=185542 RepID=A0ABC8RU97_9AQUA
MVGLVPMLNESCCGLYRMWQAMLLVGLMRKLYCYGGIKANRDLIMLPDVHGESLMQLAKLFPIQ